MEDEPLIDASTAIQSASEDQDRPLWLRALLRPLATGAQSGAMDAGERLLLERTLPCLEAGLSQLTGAPISIRTRVAREEPSTLPLREEAFALRLALSGDGRADGAAYLTFDQGAARAIVDALEARLAGVRGVGDLTDAELGLLEFVGLELLERLAREVEALRGRVRIEAFLSGQEVLRELAASGLVASAAFGLHVGARGGTLVLWSAARTGAPSACPRPPHEAREGCVWVALALPPVELDHERAASLRAGDVVLLGTADLHSFGTSYRLVSATGWELARASLIEDSPTQASARAGELRPTVARHEPSRPGLAALVATLGWLELDLDQLEAWRAGDALAFTKRRAGAVGLHGPGSSVSGELVRIGEEVGVRVLA